MSQRGRHFTHAAEPRHMEHFRLNLVQQPIAFLALGEIANESDKMAAAFKLYLAD